ncbi:MAG: zf-TFIIB domain-containing protein [Acidobacteria bacterium]|nr:zf-TFIIB domain-containing protein [Acidobacteriota bacterium]
MNCPVCKTRSFESREIEPKLDVEVCKTCRGIWISRENYDVWLDHHGAILPEIPGDADPNMTIPEFELARLCPKCRRILIKYKVGRNLPFNIDRCGNCAGVWLDRDEWETLKSRNLHDELNRVFTDHWQEEVKRETTRAALKSIYEEKFGEEDYAKIRDFKRWADSHEKGDEILAYIRDKNPLQF